MLYDTAHKSIIDIDIDSPGEFMPDLYMAEIYEPGAIFLSLSVTLFSSTSTQRATEKL